jgi:hypothetical protein
MLTRIVVVVGGTLVGGTQRPIALQPTTTSSIRIRSICMIDGENDQQLNERGPPVSSATVHMMQPSPF